VAANAQVAPAAREASWLARRAAHQRIGLKTFLRSLLEERGRLTTGQALAALEASDAFRDAMPSRNTVVSRLGDLVRDGAAESAGRGIYVLPHHGAGDGVVEPQGLAKNLSRSADEPGGP
jgi:hypothetical protein